MPSTSYSRKINVFLYPHIHESCAWRRTMQFSVINWLFMKGVTDGGHDHYHPLSLPRKYLINELFYIDHILKYSWSIVVDVTMRWGQITFKSTIAFTIYVIVSSCFALILHECGNMWTTMTIQNITKLLSQ